MSEVPKKNRSPELTPTQQRFIGFVAAHANKIQRKSHDDVRRVGEYLLDNSMQLFPFLGNVWFEQVSRIDADEQEVVKKTKIEYGDSRENTVPWLEIELNFDLDGDTAAVSAPDTENAFFVLQGDSYAYDDDVFAAEVMDRIELLETGGLLVLSDL